MRFLTGIKPTGELHLGNYLGAIKPALNLSGQGLFCVADYHALTTSQNPETLSSDTIKMCAALISLGCGLNGKVIYRQSKIPEVQELAWILSCLSPAGLMERGHAVKAAKTAGATINLGTFNYPILMAADILLFGTESVPVGKDQHQHVQIAQLLADKVNHRAGFELFKSPQALISDVGIVPGLDGEKMSKSNYNTIPFFLEPKEMKKKVYGIKTSSTPREEIMDPDTCTVFKLYQHFATEEQIETMRLNYVMSHYGYGNAKDDLARAINNVVKRSLEYYQLLLDLPEQIEEQLLEDESLVRTIAQKTLSNVKSVVGL